MGIVVGRLDVGGIVKGVVECGLLDEVVVDFD